MIKLSNTNVYNFENALRGARNPMNSWERSDSYRDVDGSFVLGTQDIDLLQKLCAAGTDHRKFMRQIFVSVDILAPLYWWKEYDTYKVGTTANSTSTMHKIHSKPFSIDDFSHDQMCKDTTSALEYIIAILEGERLNFLQTKNNQHWWNVIQLLPSSYNQLRTCTMSYENLMNMYHARNHHKLDEWLVFCDWVETLPYSEELIWSFDRKGGK